MAGHSGVAAHVATGLFDSGARNPAGPLEFFRLVTVHVRGRQKTGKTCAGIIKVLVQNRSTIYDDVVRGGSPRFSP